jgi:hypothetical protein
VPELDLFGCSGWLFMRSLVRVSKPAPIYLLRAAFDGSVESQWGDEYVQNFFPYFYKFSYVLLIFATCTTN